MVPAVSPADFALEALGDRRPFLLDVREEFERRIACLDDDAHIPLGQLEERVGELDPDADIVVYCRSGARSARAVEFLLARGFRRVRNLDRGILGWAEEVDPSTPTY